MPGAGTGNALPHDLRDPGQGQHHLNVVRITHQVGPELRNDSPLLDLTGFLHQTVLLDTVNCPDHPAGLVVESRRPQSSNFNDVQDIPGADSRESRRRLPRSLENFRR